MVYEATCSAPVNIAVIKYWGKRQTKLILPTNSSLSVTLSQDDLRSTTTIRASESFSKDRLWLNGKEEDGVNEGRTGTCIQELRSLRKQYEDKDASLPQLSTMHIHIVSANNFPTAAGLASSASGFAALAFTLYTVYDLQKAGVSLNELSRISRQGSGSACRSIFGGYVAWQMGEKADGEDSLAVQVADKEHWPNMEALICVVSDVKKGTSSTSGMQRTVETSPLLQHRIKDVVPKRMQQMTEAIQKKDFATFAELTMQDSNQFHAVCMDTHPPIFYMNDTSRAIIAAVNELSRASGKTIAAYTYDAGPNAVIYAERQNMPAVKSVIEHYFTGGNTQGALPQGFDEKNVSSAFKGGVSRLIHTRVGDGPRVLDTKEGLIGEDGLPRA